MRNDEYLSIAEFAKRAGVTRQTVYKKLTTELTDFVNTVDNKKVINIKALELFGVAVVDKNATTTFTDLAAYFDKQLERFDRLIDNLEDDKEKLFAELEIKNEQIEALHTQIDQEQKLHAMTQQTSVSAHKLLSDSHHDPFPSPVNQDQIDAAYERGKADVKINVRAEVEKAYNEGVNKGKYRALRDIKSALVATQQVYPEAARYFFEKLKEGER